MQVPLNTPRKRPRQTRSLALVDAIVEAAARLLVREGRDALTTNAVAELAGVSIGSLYQYFLNRESVIAAVADRHARELQTRMREIDVARAATLGDAMAQIVAATFGAHRIAPALHAALGREVAEAQDALPGGTRPVIAGIMLALPARLHAEIARPCPATAARTVAEIVHALAHSAMADPAPVPMLEREAATAALAYLRAPGEADGCLVSIVPVTSG